MNLHSSVVATCSQVALQALQQHMSQLAGSSTRSEMYQKLERLIQKTMRHMDTAELAASLELLLSGGKGISRSVLDQAVDHALIVIKVSTS